MSLVRGEKRPNVAGAVGIATNLLLFAIKLLAGFLSGSVAVMADAVNNLTDSGSSIVMLVGFSWRASRRMKSTLWPRPHRVFIRGDRVPFIVLFLGLQLGMTSVEKILAPQPADFSALALGHFGGVGAAEAVAVLFLPQRGDHPLDTVFATSSDSRNDAIATTVVLLGP